jgi:hypothetical protein
MVFDNVFQFIERIDVSDVMGGEWWGQYKWFQSLNGFEYFFNGIRIVRIDFEEYKYDMVSMDLGNSLLLSFENKIYFIGEKIQLLSEDITFTLYDENVFQIKNSVASILLTGYLEYSKNQGLTQINKYLNLQTGEIFLESETRPTITVTQVQPIN